MIEYKQLYTIEAIDTNETITLACKKANALDDTATIAALLEKAGMATKAWNAFNAVTGTLEATTEY